MIDVLKQGAVDGGKVSKSYVPETCPALADLTLKPVSWALTKIVVQLIRLLAGLS